MLENGARIELRLLDVRADQVAYAVELRAPDQSWQSHASLRLSDGQVTLEQSEGASEPPQWLRDAARALLRGLWRGRADTAAQWPKRVTRWRAEPGA